MKRAVWVSIVLSALVFAGCGNKVSNPLTNNTPEQKFSVAKSESVARETSTASTDNISQEAQSINKFAVAMYNRLKQEGKNLFISPYSITEALAMTAAGANGATKQQIRDALQANLDGSLFDQALNGLDQSITGFASVTDGITLKIVNSTWMQSGWDFKVSYLDYIAKYYGAGVNLLDFVTKPEDSRLIINTWVADQTNNKILDLIPSGGVNSSTRLVLTNAIYFLGNWMYSFNADYTVAKNFNLLDKSTVQAPIMSLNKPDSLVQMRYTYQSGFRALDFPYKGDRLVMTVILPDVDSFASVEKALSPAMLNQAFSALNPRKLKVSIPKFKFTYGTASLTDAFKALGMQDAFSSQLADFSAIDGSKSLSVGDIYHKAFISVDENGTEAAAATAAIMETSLAEQPVIFVVDRPFIFVIRDRTTGAILFIGRILNPLATE